MNNSWLFLSLVLAHVIGDFYLQSDKYCKQKEEKSFRSWFLYAHSLIIGILSWLLVPVRDFGMYALLIVVSHFIIDILKSYFVYRSCSFPGSSLMRKPQPITNGTLYPNGSEEVDFIETGEKHSTGCKLAAFVVDQLAHFGVLAIISMLFRRENLFHNENIFHLDGFYHAGNLFHSQSLFYGNGSLPIQLLDCSATFSVPFFVLAVLLCLKPANILIKLILEKYQVGESASCNNIKNAGALIGNLERLLTIIFVLIGQYEAIGFIIAAKSILRFKDTDTAKTEYVLAGTFLSFGIAIVCGLLARM